MDVTKLLLQSNQMAFFCEMKVLLVHVKITLILLAFITRNSSLEPLREGLFAQIHIDLR